MSRAVGGVHVLAYHLVGAGTRSPVDTPAADFRHQMERLAAHGGAVTLDAALEILAGRRAAPADRPAVVLTFDDAYRNFVTTAWPLLRDLGLPATLYVPTAFVDGTGEAPIAGTEDLPPASWGELARLRDEGVTLGSHSHAHRDLPGLGDDAVTADLALARDLLAERLGVEARHFCYPRALASRRVERIVARHHRSAAVAGGRLNRPGSTPPLRLSRTPIRRDLGPDLEPLLGRTLQLREWLASRLRRPRAWWRRRRAAS